MAWELSKEFLALLHSITAKRPRTVIEHILKHGHVTTEELQNLYGYEHPPRAPRDVRELGIPLETFKVGNQQGRKIAAYRFADPSTVRQGILGGRRVISKEFKQSLADRFGSRCAVCLTAMELRYLQVDHRIPYEVAGESGVARDIKDFMLICGSCNRAKSWSCEHCPNWTRDHKPKVCKTCYWASPENFKHVAMQEQRRLDVTWNDEEVGDYDQLAKLAKQAGKSVAEFVKLLVRELATRKS